MKAVGNTNISLPWTPTVTFATPGDLSVVYSTQVGVGRRTGDLIILQADIITSTFTFTTASGIFQLMGIPVPPLGTTGLRFSGSVQITPWTKANFTQITPRVTAAAPTVIDFLALGSAQPATLMAATDFTTGSTLSLHVTICYIAGS